MAVRTNPSVAMTKSKKMYAHFKHLHVLFFIFFNAIFKKDNELPQDALTSAYKFKHKKYSYKSKKSLKLRSQFTI